MSSEQRKLIFNPVMAAPWGMQVKNCENPSVFQSQGENGQGPKQAVSFKHKTKRDRNIETLIMRFPGLKKYQARAALTMSKNQLDKAIVLLEVSSCYRKRVVEKNRDLAYLRDIHINLWYDAEEHDPTLRNIVFESFFCDGTNTSSLSLERSSESETEQEFGTILRSRTRDQRKSPISEANRVGVVIIKTPNGYKATLL